MNAYCRKGPGTSYDEITFLASGSAYNVIGRNSLNTWWLVQVPGNLTCWTGAPGTSQLGSVQQAPIVLVPPALLAPSLFVGSYVCDVSTTKHTLSVSLDWALVDKATGYHLYLNGILLAELGPNVTAYHNNAPLNEDLVYELEAFDSYSVSPRVVVRVPSCD